MASTAGRHQPRGARGRRPRRGAGVLRALAGLRAARPRAGDGVPGRGRPVPRAVGGARAKDPDDDRHFGLVVDDRDAVRAALAEAGIEPERGRGLLVRDPWGNLVEIVDYREIQFTKAPGVLAGMGLDGLGEDGGRAARAGRQGPRLEQSRTRSTRSVPDRLRRARRRGSARSGFDDHLRDDAARARRGSRSRARRRPLAVPRDRLDLRGPTPVPEPRSTAITRPRGGSRPAGRRGVGNDARVQAPPDVAPAALGPDHERRPRRRSRSRRRASRSIVVYGDRLRRPARPPCRAPAASTAAAASSAITRPTAGSPPPSRRRP